jgi:hypothetical protein
MTAHIRTITLIAALTAGVAALPAAAAEHAPASSQAAADDSVTTGSIGAGISGPLETREQRLKDCMEIWEPATHMTKRQWRRTCVNQLGDKPDL